ncbi:MAG: purine-nucleoside phosphorylase, partial [Bacteroidota bacterium]|nr:purine-nucleoside phosphorylase [Bacteroidota bacterium]
MSIHNEARKGDIAPTVLLPGDPLRAKFIAENFLETPVCYNHIRGMLGYTGIYKGVKVSVQGTGMGMPSLAIYVQELIEQYDVQNLIRIGTCGTFQDHVQVKDLILAMGASTDSQMNKIRFKGLDYSPIASFDLLNKAYNYAIEQNIPVKVGNVLSSDFFYSEPLLGDAYEIWKAYNILAVEMESSALYTIAARFGRNALSILTVSDHILKGEKATQL